MSEHPAYPSDLAPSDFSVPEDKRNIEKKAFLWHWWHQEWYNGSSEGHFTKPIPKLFWRLDYALASVHSFPRGVLWRRPRWYSAVRYVALLPRQVRELYCQIKYIEIGKKACKCKKRQCKTNRPTFKYDTALVMVIKLIEYPFSYIRIYMEISQCKGNFRVL